MKKTFIGLLLFTLWIQNSNFIPFSRIAFVVLDFPEVCFNQKLNQPCGFSALQIKLLRIQGYHVVEVPFSEFNTSEKILNRVQYLDDKLKEILKKA